MKSDGAIQVGTEVADLESDPRWELAQRVAHSSVLSRAAQLRAILLYIVRQAIIRPEEAVHEFEIAYRVLGRRKDFNPQDDSIVRVQVGQLRKRLDFYFADEGKSEEVVITIALGTYEPIFTNRSKLASNPRQIHEAEVNDKSISVIGDEVKVTGTKPAESRQELDNGRVRIAWTIGLCLATLILGGIVGFRVRRSELGRSKSLQTSNPILRLIFAPNVVVNVVVADTSLVFLQNTVHSDISVADYIDPKYPDNILVKTSNPALRSILKDLTLSRYTSLNDADVIDKCSHWGTILGANTSVRYARYMHVRDFQSGNFVIVGSRRGNPWTSMFEPNLNFVFVEDPVTHVFHFRNRNPKPGELSTYKLESVNGRSAVGYVDISILPNLSGTGSVLLINGFSSETNEAATNLIFKGDLPPALSSALSSLSQGSKAEIFLRVRNLDKAEVGWDIVSIRNNSN